MLNDNQEGGRGKRGDPDRLETAIGRWMETVRRDAGYAQGAFADKFDLDPANVSKWERGLSLPSNPMQIVAVYARATGRDLESAWTSIVIDWIAHQPQQLVQKIAAEAKEAEQRRRRQRR